MSHGRPGVGFVIYDIHALGGMERQAKRLAERLVARGVPVTVFSAFYPGRFARARTETWQGVEILHIPLHEHLFKLVDCWRFLDAWLVDALAHRPHIDVLYGVHYSGGFHAVRAGLLAGLPVAIKFAGSGDYGDFSTLRRRDHAEEFGEVIRRAQAFVCLSRSMQREAEEFGLCPDRLTVIPNGIDVAAVRARADPRRDAVKPLPWGPGVKAVLYVGRLGQEKGVDVLIEAFARVLALVPAAVLYCAGDGPARPALEALARDLGLSDAVQFLGQRDDVERLLAGCDVFALPSWSEGLSNALLEALAVGAPIVATDVPGNSEVVRHGREALLAPPGDREGFAAALTRILSDPALARALASGARERADDYDLAQVAARYEVLFERLAQRRCSATRRDRVRTRAALFGEVVRLTGLAAADASRYVSLEAERTVGAGRRAISNGVCAGKARLGVHGDLAPWLGSAVLRWISRRLRGRVSRPW